jgi:polyisoprenyl-phosphate glycosyltransferase
VSQKLISIVIPAYNEVLNIPQLYDEITKNIEKLSYKFEIIFIDDGSEDGSADAILKLRAHDRRIRLIRLARNFGKEAAVSAGLHYAKGNAAIIMDADLQMPPSLLGKFIHRWEEGGEVVVGVFSARNMSRIRRYGANLFYSIMQRISHTEITPNATDYRLLDRQVINTFNKLTERNRITRGLIDWMGYHRSYVYFKQRPRGNGTPSYSMRKLIALAMNSMTAFSLLPLRLAGYLGVVILILSIPLGVALTIIRFVFRNPFHWALTGTTLLAVLILFLVGVVLACLGLMSLYIAHIYAEVTNRPLYVTRDEESDLT